MPLSERPSEIQQDWRIFNLFRLGIINYIAAFYNRALGICRHGDITLWAFVSVYSAGTGPVFQLRRLGSGVDQGLVFGLVTCLNPWRNSDLPRLGYRVEGE